MGNKMGRACKVMKITGETFKLKIPARVFDVIKDYPDHVLLESGDFIRFHLRAKPLGPFQQLKPNRIYLLFILPKLPLQRSISGGHHRNLQSVKVNRRSISDVSFLTNSTTNTNSDDEMSSGRTRVKIRLPKAMLERVIEESRDDDEVAETILQIYLQNFTATNTSTAVAAGGEKSRDEEEDLIKIGCFDMGALCSPRRGGKRKYRRLMSST